MDTSIRNLLVLAQKNSGIEKNPSLLQAYGLLRNVAETQPAVDAPEPFGPDLYVLCAEIAFQNSSPDMARECLKMFFMKPPPANQFLCRAYLCQAQLLAPQDANSPEKLEKAVVYLLKAISFAKKNQRYHFLVYNASVLYWQFCRPFLKPNYRQYLARSLHQVVKALDDIDDKDYEWRAQLMIALIECHLDAGRRSDASHIAAAAVTFIKQNVPSLHKQVFGLMVRHQLVESTKFHRDLKNSPELSIYYKICKIKVSLENGEQKEYYSEIQSIMNQMGVPYMSSRTARYDKVSVSSRPRSPSMSPTGKEEDVPKDRKSPGKGGRRTPTPTTSKKIAVDSADKPYLLLELGRLCLDLDFADLGESCVEHTKTCVVKEQGFYLELEFLQCELMVKLMGDKQESYHKSAIDVRQHAIKRCEESIMNAIRQGDPNIVQAGCVTQWNLCLPLLQSNLRQSVRKPLTLLAEALEDVQSLLIQLRCQVHTELAKCEEDREQIQVAMEHLRKALSLDDGGVYRERLEVSLHRLELRSELYKTPERPEDQAAMIIEQARTADSGTIRMKRSLLVKAGEALAPDAFLLVLDSESDTKDVAGGKGPLTVIRQLAGKARQFSKCVKKAEGHLKRLGNENERERARLWADLAKTARKQEVWDVCRVAARFCLLYDDGRWKNAPPVKAESPKLERSRTAERESRDETSVAEKSSSRMGSRPATPIARVGLYDKDLIRILAEINFIQGEAMIHLLRGEGVQLNDQPIPPKDKSKHPKGYVPKKPEEDPEWIEYCDWINSLSESSTDSFLRGLTLGVELNEPWLVCSAAAYVWNYNNHVFTQDRHREVINTLTAVLEGLKAVGHAGETVMLANICNALATGLMKPWMPEPPPRDSLEASPSPSPGDKSPSKKGKSAVPGGSGKSKSPYTVSISPDAMPDLKKAIEVCEYAMQVTNGDNHNDVVPISVRLPLLQTWVFVKQMAQIQINKNLGTEDDHNTEGQKPMTRAIVATEMMCLSKNGIMEFKETPFIGDIVQMVDGCSWTDKFVELQLWSRLTYQAFLAKLHNLVMKCSKQALKFANVGTTPKGKKVEAHRYMVEQEMLSYSSGLQGQSLMENMGGKNALRREAMEAFLNSARFARNANNYELVMTAARHYWNACIPLVGQPIERELLKEPIRVILQCITATAEKTQKKEDKSDQKEESPGKKEVAVKTEETKDVAAAAEEKKASMIGNPEEDLTLRAALYGVLFQSYADKGEWELALQSMDQAINDMPRTKHRLLIFKHRVMVKAKLGRAVHMDIQKFKDESEDYVAHMWRRVALSSKEKSEQMSSYQYAIEALSNPSSEWQKVDYLIEFGQWLYVNDFPLPDAIDQIEWAIDILLNMKSGVTAESQKKDEKGGLKGEAKKGQMKAKREKKKPGKASARPKGGSVGRKSPDAGKKTPDNMSKASDARSDVSDSESEINPADYIPVIKQAEIGVLAANPGLTMSELTDISQLDALIRTHVILAEIHGRNSQCYTDICLMAHGYLMQLWKVCMSSVGPVMKEIAKNPSDTTVAGKKSANTKKDPKKDKEVTKEKPKRKGPLDALPSSTEEWAVYDVPDEALEAFKHETMKKTGITADTLQKPMLTLYCLDVLTKILHDIGFTHLTLPVLAFQDLMSRGLLHNNALHVLVHVRSMEVCQELDLKTGASFHEKVISPIVISEDDQARSREEIAVMKEKQTQVAREEMRVKATLAQLGDETAVKKRGQTPGFQSIKLDEIVETESHLGKVLGAVTFQEIWADTAEVLIRQGLYPRARQFLNEAMIAAKEFKDAALEARILYLLAKLSFEESQYGQAINLCKMAQDLHSGDEVFWYETTVLMIDATKCDYENRQARRAARKILIHSLNEFSKIYDERPNRMSITGYILADLEGRLASVQADILLKEHKNVNNPQIMKGVLSSCEKFENATENLIKLSYKREALPVMKKHAGVLRHLAREAIEKDLAHMYYLQSVLVLKDATALAEEIHHDSQTLFSLQETRNLSLPVQRELVDLEIELGAVLTEVLHVQAKEARLQQLEDQRKGSVLKMVEDLIRQTPTYTHMEREWEEAKQNCGEEAISSLLSAHSLSGNIPHLRARSLCQLGKCLSILSQHSGPDPPPQWLVHEMELLRVNTGGGEEGEEEEHKGEEEDQGVVNKHLHKYTKQIKTMKHQHEVSKLYLSLATECLTQCLNLCLAKKYIDLAGLASLELVDCFGQFDPGTASNFLALYQSCAASQAFKSVLCRSQLDPVTSRLAALLNQRERLISRDVQTNLSNSPLMVSVNTSLEDDWQAWKKIEVMPNHVELLREFPPNFNFVVLQHSPDKTFLYGALLDKLGKATTGGGKSNPKQIAAAKAAASSAPSKARVYGMETSPRQLEDLISKFRQHKQSVQQMLLKQEYQRTQAAQRTRMLENLDQDMKGLESKPQTEGEAAREVERLQEEFRALVAAMDDYLKPIMAPIETAFRATQSPQSSINVGKDAKVEPTPSQECVVVLADLDLLEMPLEALECLKSDNIFSLSRDFSLQLFYHRFHQEQPPAEEGGDKKKKKADASQIVSRIPGAREAKQKQAKIIPLDRKPEPWQLAVDTMNFKYIVDPNVDCSETEEHKPLDQFNKVLEEYEQQFTPRWLGLTGQEHMPSVGEWEIYISESSSFVFYGMERFLSYLPPSKISALNIPECMMVYSLDMSQTSKSFLRQSKVDVLKSHNNLALEKPVESAMLVSMSGVKCVLANQWHCTLAENSDRFNLTIKDLLEKGKTTGETVRLLFSPKKRKQEEDKAQSELEGRADSVATGSGKGEGAGQKGGDTNRSKDSESQKGGKSRPESKEETKEGEEDPDKDKEEPKEPEEMLLQRDWFNMVCYGLPNLIITHV